MGAGTDPWTAFVGVLAELAEVSSEEIGRDTRLVQDLDLDSMALVELIVSVLVDLGVDSMPEELWDTEWTTISAGTLFDACIDQEQRWTLQWNSPDPS